MNYSIDKITLPSGEVKYQLRIWNSGRGAKQMRRRFSSRKGAQDFLDKMSREEMSANSEIDRLFGDEYLHWRKVNDENFAPGWRANLDGYWRECRGELELRKLSQLAPALAELRQRWKSLSQKTINNKMGFIYAVLNFSVEEKRISHNPLGTFKKPKRQDADIEFWERHEAESFLAFLFERCQDWKYQAVNTVLNTGIRAGELWALRPGDLKPDRGSMRISRQLNRVSKAFAATKGKKNRSVPLNQALAKELLSLAKNKKPTDLLFQNDGRPVCHDFFREWFDKQVKDWKGKRITFHGLRHSAATLMLLSGVDIKSLQEILGHEDISTTMKYVHAVGDAAKRASEKFNVSPRNNVLRMADFG